MQHTKTNFVCICCPLGCHLNVNYLNSEYVITGNKCPRGKKYAIEEITAPTRVVTSTVKIVGGLYPVIPIKTNQPIPKDKIFTIMKILASVIVKVPVIVGDIVVENIDNTGVNILATKSMFKISL